MNFTRTKISFLCFKNVMGTFPVSWDDVFLCALQIIVLLKDIAKLIICAG